MTIPMFFRHRFTLFYFLLMNLRKILLTSVTAITVSFNCFAAYNQAVEKTLKKQFRDVTYLAHSDCYLVTSKIDKVSKGVCNSAGEEVVPANYKRISFEKDDNSEVIIFAMGPNFRADSQGNIVYSLKKGKILDMGRSEPQYIPGGFLSSNGKAIYNLSGNLVLDCEMSSVQPIRIGKEIKGYKVGNRRMVNGGFKDELIICNALFNKLFELDGLDYLWKVETLFTDNKDIQWKCSKNLGGEDYLILLYAADGTLLESNEGKDMAAAQPMHVDKKTEGVNLSQTVVSKSSAPAPSQPAAQHTTIQQPIKQSSSAPKKISDIDRNPPVNSTVNDKTFAVIISNENYSEVENVKYAHNDGLIVSQYFNKTLGIPEKNIKYVPDATLNNMRKQIHWLEQIADAFGQEAKIIFYYSGHGVPDEQSKNAYLMPVDGYHSDMSTNLSLNQLYENLSNLNVAQVTVFMDACFSGSQRGDNMLVAARGVKIKSRANTPKGKLVVFSAAQGDETAYPLDDEGHGLFTYFLLKKIREDGNKVTLGDLSDYITSEVKKASLVHNGKIQTPSTSVSPLMQSVWREATF